MHFSWLLNKRIETKANEHTADDAEALLLKGNLLRVNLLLHIGLKSFLNLHTFHKLTFSKDVYFSCLIDNYYHDMKVALQ